MLNRLAKKAPGFSRGRSSVEKRRNCLNEAREGSDPSWIVNFFRHKSVFFLKDLEKKIDAFRCILSSRVNRYLRVMPDVPQCESWGFFLRKGFVRLFYIMTNYRRCDSISRGEDKIKIVNEEILLTYFDLIFTPELLSQHISL